MCPSFLPILETQSLRHSFCPDDPTTVKMISEFLEGNFLALAKQRNAVEVLRLLFMPNISKQPHELTFSAVVALQKKFLELSTRDHLVSFCLRFSPTFFPQIQLLYFVSNTIREHSERLKRDLGNALDAAQAKIRQIVRDSETCDRDGEEDFDYMGDVVDIQVKEGQLSFWS